MRTREVHRGLELCKKLFLLPQMQNKSVDVHNTEVTNLDLFIYGSVLLINIYVCVYISVFTQQKVFRLPRSAPQPQSPGVFASLESSVRSGLTTRTAQTVGATQNVNLVMEW